MDRRERTSRRAGTGVALMFAVAFTAAALSSAAAQPLVPFRIGMQLPPPFEYLYVHFAVESGLLRNEEIEAKIVGFTAGLTATQAVAGGSLDAACDGFTSSVECDCARLAGANRVQRQRRQQLCHRHA